MTTTRKYKVPGGWSYDGSNIYDEYGMLIGTVSMHHIQLICSAPLLLEACKTALRESTWRDYHYFKAGQQLTRDAVAEATKEPLPDYSTEHFKVVSYPDREDGKYRHDVFDKCTQVGHILWSKYGSVYKFYVYDSGRCFGGWTEPWQFEEIGSILKKINAADQ